ncbi:hypothetical protein IEN85_00335 [Pelagicoccus sp. NFK12]|uniref:PhoD-like phosphatase metallophosphatase domain-containing protein n=1 Tax=Pelagicoccus enzymogenes TaxID=2773457 RepID=A0A927F3W7_9BACT|nr:hypothetical protein [Pelagicoccus enzymogenes]MBD5777939.1 hypothetical protein [Pelagicoccus enzymogenes]
MELKKSITTLLFATCLAGQSPAQEATEAYRKAPFEELDTFAVNDWWNRNECWITPMKVERDEVLAFGLYTVARQTLKLTAQLYPLYPDESRDVYLDIKENGRWKQIAKAPVYDLGWSAHFRIADWDDTKDTPYRLRHGDAASFEGLIRANPIHKDEIVLASLSCNSNQDRGPRDNYVRNLRIQDPDILFFAGDQSYFHNQHTAGWLLWGKQFRDIIRDRPTITIPDDHDIGQGNLWGEGGKKASTYHGDDGGYYYSPDYVRMVERCQTWHLPDAYDPAPVEQGIGVYYTDYPIGGIELAIIEDRKFKSGPLDRVPMMGERVDLVLKKDYDPDALDLPGLTLLGERQLAFLHNWAQPKPNQPIRAVLSQTGFAGAAHFSGNLENRVYADLDSNGWPRSGRNKALRIIRDANAIHIAGDQHLATVLQHGIDEHDNGPWSFVSPAIVNNYWSRWWKPSEEELAATSPIGASKLPWTGRFKDGFGNPLTMHAYANPENADHGAGYGLIRFRKRANQVVFECWARSANLSQDNASQFPGWPVTIDLTTQERVK